MKRCRGSCCERFYLPFTPEELKAEEKLAWEGKSRFLASEIIQVANMVIPLDNDADHNGNKRKPKNGYYYTCGHHDSVTGDCMIYSIRPRMCRDYPYGRDCDYNSCANAPWWKRHAITRWGRKLYVRISNYRLRKRVEELQYAVKSSEALDCKNEEMAKPQADKV